MARRLARLGQVPAADRVGLGALTLIGVTLWIGLPTELAIVLIVIAGGVAVASPIATTAAVAAAAPLVFQPVDVGSSRFSLLELVLVTGAFGLATRVALEARAARSPAPMITLCRPWGTTLVAAALIGLGAVSLSTIADVDRRPESLRELRVTVVEPVIALFLVRWSARRGGTSLVIAALLGTSLVIAGAAAIELARGAGVLGDQVRRATGPYAHPNNLALYFDRATLLAVGLALARPARRRWIAAAVVAALAAIVLTSSRGALLALAAGGAVAVVMTRARTAWRWYPVMVVAAVAAFGLAAGERLSATGSAEGPSTRELIWRASVEMIKDRPIFGFGLDQFFLQYGQRYAEPAGWAERYTSHPHNLILDVWLRLGVLGLLLFGVLAVVIVRRARLVHAVGPSRWSPVAVAATVALAAGLAHGMVDNGFFLPDLAVLTWLLIGLQEFDAVAPGADGAQP